MVGIKPKIRDFTNESCLGKIVKAQSHRFNDYTLKLDARHSLFLEDAQ
jgi:hypothetical protein